MSSLENGPTLAVTGEPESGRPATGPASAERVALIYERAADALDQSAHLAEAHAEWHSRSGHGEAAEEERRAASRAHHAAARARDAALRARRSAAGG